MIQLLECCDENLRKDITRNAGGSLADKTVKEAMAAIKKLAVREENAMVARVQLSNMRQDRDKPLCGFGARLRGQASVCKFTIPCPSCTSDVNYTEHILRDILIRGLADNEIQLDILGDKNQDMSLEEVFLFVEAKESGKRSAGRLLQTHRAEAARSQYRKKQYEELRHPTGKADPPKNKQEQCSYCGQRGHGKNTPPRVRKEECPAYGETCKHCSKRNHFEIVCRSKDTPMQPRAPYSTSCA